MEHFQEGYFYSRPFHGWIWLLPGMHGVAIFFVLSGYLISSRLLEDNNLKSFYVRRFFRLMPAAWAYLACIALIGAVFGLHIIGSDAIPCLLFYRNFWPAHQSPQTALTGHFWSLSVEEQFYLVWPALLVAFKRYAMAFAIVGIAAFSFSRSTWPYAALLVGCVLAFAAKRPAFPRVIGKHYGWLFPAALVLFGCCVVRYHGYVPLVESITIAVMLACSSAQPDQPFSRPLEWKWLATLGVGSYSLYVWQQLCLMTHTGFIGLMILPVIAAGSYCLIEQPGRRLGAAILKRKAHATPLVDTPAGV